MSRPSIGSTAPAAEAFAITPDDDNDLTIPTRAIYIGTEGNLKVDMMDSGTAVTFVGLLAGVIYPLSVKRVYSTGTTAGSIVGIY